MRRVSGLGGCGGSRQWISGCVGAPPTPPPLPRPGGEGTFRVRVPGPARGTDGELLHAAPVARAGQAPPLRHQNRRFTGCRRGGPWAARGDCVGLFLNRSASHFELERSREAVVTNPDRETRAYRIGEYVQGRLIERLVVPDGSIEKAALPDLAGATAPPAGRAAQGLPRSNESRERDVLSDADQQVYVVRHQTVCVAACARSMAVARQRCDAVPSEIDIREDGRTWGSSDCDGEGPTGLGVDFSR